MKWMAYCTKCKKDLTEGGWENGAMVEAVARLHLKEVPHEVILGFILKRKEEKDEDSKREGGV